VRCANVTARSELPSAEPPTALCGIGTAYREAGISAAQRRRRRPQSVTSGEPAAGAETRTRRAVSRDGHARASGVREQLLLSVHHNRHGAKGAGGLRCDAREVHLLFSYTRSRPRL